MGPYIYDVGQEGGGGGGSKRMGGGGDQLLDVPYLYIFETKHARD